MVGDPPFNIFCGSIACGVSDRDAGVFSILILLTCLQSASVFSTFFRHILAWSAIFAFLRSMFSFFFQKVRPQSYAGSLGFGYIFLALQRRVPQLQISCRKYGRDILSRHSSYGALVVLEYGSICVRMI